MLGENYWSDPGGLANMKNSDYVKIRYNVGMTQKLTFFLSFNNHLSSKLSLTQVKTSVLYKIKHLFSFYNTSFVSTSRPHVKEHDCLGKYFPKNTLYVSTWFEV